MNLGTKGIALLREFEGYHTRQPDGSCVAYLDRLAKPPVWTVGFGLTEGVHEGMRLTAEEAEAIIFAAGGEEQIIKKLTDALEKPNAQNAQTDPAKKRNAQG